MTKAEKKISKAAYYQKNKAKIAAKMITYREANKDKFVERRIAYYKTNKERLLAKAAIYRQANKEKIDTYRDANKETISTQRAKHRRTIKKEIAKYNIIYNQANAMFATVSPQIDWVEEVRRSPENKEELQVRCALCGCWFSPNNTQVKHRIEAINGDISGDSNFYCSDACKKACPVFNQHKYRKGDAPQQSAPRPGQREWKSHVIVCGEYTCERCGEILNEENLIAHHIRSVSQFPLESMDIDNGMSLCKDCDAIVHSEIGCRPVDLRCNA